MANYIILAQGQHLITVARSPSASDAARASAALNRADRAIGGDGKRYSWAVRRRKKEATSND